MDRLGCVFCRARGVVHLSGEGSFALNGIAGRWELDPLSEAETGDTTDVVLTSRLAGPELPLVELLESCETLEHRPGG
jgi:hypothetical protein